MSLGNWVVIAKSCFFSMREIVLEDMQPVVWIITIPFAILCLFSFFFRLYARRYVTNSFGVDDWLMFVGLFIWIVQQYIAWMWTILGGGLGYLFIEEFWYLLLQFIIKLSFLFFYRRTLNTTIGFQRTLYVVMGFVTCQTVGTWVFYGLQCIPIQAYFHPERYPDVHCVASALSYYLPSVANVLMDVVIYLIPVPIPWRLQASRRRRFELIALFTLGGGTVIVSLLRFIVLWQLSNTLDTTYVFGSVTIVTSVEFAAAIITANTPGTAALYRDWRGKNRSGSTWSRPEVELGNVATVGSMPNKHKMGFSKHTKSRIRTESEEDLNAPRVLRHTGTSSRNVTVERSVVVTHSSPVQAGLDKSSALPVQYYQFK
ncbi:Uu.00g138280.m01.CDS01 [Anthostomella pinea]|uniref:Uu.00g138280.m01.CDS01 n=1 Tax=Anthostomella pinea TaxID=933095 RepID=A0AAI8VQV6_9PEZI|nr:Uu.00g138280.m01.CDS01 [Anthostomella pinea]